MREVLAQALRLFAKMTRRQKKWVVCGGGICCALGCWFLLSHPFSSYVMLYPDRELTESEKKHTRNYLNLLVIPYKEKRGIQVPAKQVDRIRMELEASSKTEQGKGFELFDTNTWIKGEKELQVLEMRALKGQLERDLVEFENIKHASVILDLAPARQFGAPQGKTKASVILTLMPHTHLTASQLRAITYHLAGAVRGLEPTMVAISDTKGRLYQAIDPDATEQISDQALIIEAQIQEKIERLLVKIFGEENFFTSAQMGPTQTMEVSIVINKLACETVMQDEITRQVQAIGRGYGVNLFPTIDIFPFETKRQETTPVYPHLNLLLLGLLGVMVIVGAVTILFLFRKQREKEQDILADVMTRVDFRQLAESLEGEDPETLALMLSYLETKRAEEILAAFPAHLQEEVLAELEKVT